MIAFPRGEEILWSDLTPGVLFGVSIRSETPLSRENSGQTQCPRPAQANSAE